jgi:hypothetical protein
MGRTTLRNQEKQIELSRKRSFHARCMSNPEEIQPKVDHLNILRQDALKIAGFGTGSKYLNSYQISW